MILVDNPCNRIENLPLSLLLWIVGLVVTAAHAYVFTILGRVVIQDDGSLTHQVVFLHLDLTLHVVLAIHEICTKRQRNACIEPMVDSQENLVLQHVHVLFLKLVKLSVTLEVWHELHHFCFLLMDLEGKVAIIKAAHLSGALDVDVGLCGQEFLLDRIREVDRDLSLHWDVAEVVVELGGEHAVDLRTNLDFTVFVKSICEAFSHVFEVLNCD